MPARPEFIPIDVANATQMGIDWDNVFLDNSRADYERRFGTNIVPGKEFAAEDAIRGLTGEVSPVLTNALKSAGLGGDFGGSSYRQSKNLGRRDILEMGKRSRNYFQQNLGLNPKEPVGPAGGDIADLTFANTGGLNNFNRAGYDARQNAYNQAVQSSINNNKTYVDSTGSILRSLGGMYAQNQPSSYLTAGGYGRPMITGNLSDRPSPYMSGYSGYGG